ncbi:hypothetical protein D3C72_2008380 [compost metagenome]
MVFCSRRLLAGLLSPAKNGSLSVRVAIGVVAAGSAAWLPIAPTTRVVPGVAPWVSTFSWKVRLPLPAKLAKRQTMRVAVSAVHSLGSW